MTKVIKWAGTPLEEHVLKLRALKTESSDKVEGYMAEIKALRDKSCDEAEKLQVAGKAVWEVLEAKAIELELVPNTTKEDGYDIKRRDDSLIFCDDETPKLDKEAIVRKMVAEMPDEVLEAIAEADFGGVVTEHVIGGQVVHKTATKAGASETAH